MKRPPFKYSHIKSPQTESRHLGSSRDNDPFSTLSRHTMEFPIPKQPLTYRENYITKFVDEELSKRKIRILKGEIETLSKKYYLVV